MGVLMIAVFHFEGMVTGAIRESREQISVSPLRILCSYEELHDNSYPIYNKILRGVNIALVMFLNFCVLFCSNRKEPRLLKLQERSTLTLRKALLWLR